MDFLKRPAEGDNPGLGATQARLNIGGKTKFAWAIKEENLNLEQAELEPKEIIKEEPL